MYSRMNKPLTDEQMLEIYRRSHTEKQTNIFFADFEKTKEDFRKISAKMTDDMYVGIAVTEEEKKIIKQYNKTARHLAKLQDTLHRLSWCL